MNAKVRDAQRALSDVRQAWHRATDLDLERLTDEELADLIKTASEFVGEVDSTQDAVFLRRNL